LKKRTQNRLQNQNEAIRQMRSRNLRFKFTGRVLKTDAEFREQTADEPETIDVTPFFKVCD
jgi:hypothetical protein